MLLVEVLNLAKKLATYQHWFPVHVNIEISAAYDKCFKENLMTTKNCVLKKSLTYIPMSFKITLNSNYSNMIRSGISTKGQVISIENSINPTHFKEIGTKNY
jgi:hypothetical protein